MGALPVCARPDEVTIHVFTAPTEFVDSDSKDRSALLAEFVKGLTRQMPKEAKKGNGYRLVQSPEEADVVIEVLAPTRRQRGFEQRDPGWAAAIGAKREQAAVYDYTTNVKLTVGDYSTTLNYPSSAGAYHSAKVLGQSEVPKWLGENRTRLLARVGKE
jgi:hypothetical protein